MPMQFRMWFDINEYYVLRRCVPGLDRRVTKYIGQIYHVGLCNAWIQANKETYITMPNLIFVNPIYLTKLGEPQGSG